MEYPKNGSVVIIDDKFEEVEDLIVELSKKNVPTYYFTGKHEKLHRKLNNIRVIFLDINYEGIPLTPKQAVTDNLVTIITKIINAKSKDYIIITWSTTTESYDEDLKERLGFAYTLTDENRKLYKKPKHIFSINKEDVKTDGIFDVDKINKEINNIVPNSDIINLAIHWENNVLESAKNVLDNFEKIAPTEDEQKKIYALFADSITQSGSLTKENIISPALAPLSGLLSDQLSSQASSEELNDLSTQLLTIVERKDKLVLSSVAKINTFYHVDTKVSCSDAPGVIYHYQEYMDKKSCSLQGCNTKWFENLLEKTLEDFEASSMDASITTLYTIELEKNKKFKMPYIQTKTYDEHVEIALNKGITLEDEIKKAGIDFSVELDEIKKKVCVEAYSKYTNQLFLNNLIVFIFAKEMDESIQEELSKENNFDDLSEKDQLEILEKCYTLKQKESIKKEHNENIIPIFLEFSPDCDYVQKNRKKLRFIFGIMYPYSFYVKDDKNFKGDNYIYTPIIDYNEMPYKIVLDLHTVTGINSETFSDIEPIFRFRKELLVDIQQKIASHIARPGFFNMNDYLAK